MPPASRRTAGVTWQVAQRRLLRIPCLASAGNVGGGRGERIRTSGLCVPNADV